MIIWHDIFWIFRFYNLTYYGSTPHLVSGDFNFPGDDVTIGNLRHGQHRGIFEHKVVVCIRPVFVKLLFGNRRDNKLIMQIKCELFLILYEFVAHISNRVSWFLECLVTIRIFRMFKRSRIVYFVDRIFENVKKTKNLCLFTFNIYLCLFDTLIEHDDCMTLLL